MIKILFLIDTLGGGGAERVLVNLVNNMDLSRFDITVETMFSDGVNADLLHENIRHLCRKAPRPKGVSYLFRFIPSELLYRYFIGDEYYDIIVAYMHGAPVKVISGCRNSKIKRIAWLHNSNPDSGSFFGFWHSKNKAFDAYRYCDAVVGVSETVAEVFSDYTGIKDNVSVVYNTNDIKSIVELSSEKNPFNDKSIHIVSVGRIAKQKGYDRLLRVCSQLKKEIPEFDVTILGSGGEEETIKREIYACGASEWFHIIGFQKNPYSYVANADLFVCSSRNEGLSTAVSEAIILGVPCVSTEVSGAKEILGENNEYGLVVANNEDALYEGIKKMLSDNNLRAFYKDKAKERSAFFATENTVKQAEDLFSNIMK